MTTCCVTQAMASATAATPPSTANIRRRPGNQRRTCFIICRIQSTLVLCRRRLDFAAGQHNVARNGHAHTHRRQGTGTNSIIETHFKPKQRITCFLVEHTARDSSLWP